MEKRQEMKRKTGWKVVKHLWSVCPGTRVFSPHYPLVYLLYGQITWWAPNYFLGAQKWLVNYWLSWVAVMSKKATCGNSPAKKEKQKTWVLGFGLFPSLINFSSFACPFRFSVVVFYLNFHPRQRNHIRCEHAKLAWNAWMHLLALSVGVSGGAYICRPPNRRNMKLGYNFVPGPGNCQALRSRVRLAR